MWEFWWGGNLVGNPSSEPSAAHREWTAIAQYPMSFCHSMFGIPVKQGSFELESQISVFSGRAELLRQAALIVWEEFPMANEAECVDSLLRRIMSNDLPYAN